MMQPLLSIMGWYLYVQSDYKVYVISCFFFFVSAWFLIIFLHKCMLYISFYAACLLFRLFRCLSTPGIWNAWFLNWKIHNAIWTLWFMKGFFFLQSILVLQLMAVLFVWLLISFEVMFDGKRRTIICKHDFVSSMVWNTIQEKKPWHQEPGECSYIELCEGNS